MILITQTFKKLLSKIKSVSLLDIQVEIFKHDKWLENFIEIWEIEWRKILKWYLLQKKVRLIVLFQEKNGKYMPFYIVKKETKHGKNISKDSIYFLSWKLDSIFNDLENWAYEILD